MTIESLVRDALEERARAAAVLDEDEAWAELRTALGPMPHRKQRARRMIAAGVAAAAAVLVTVVVTTGNREPAHVDVAGSERVPVYVVGSGTEPGDRALSLFRSADGAKVRELAGPGPVYAPAVSPDGRWVYFTEAFPTGAACGTIQRARVDGRGAPEPVAGGTQAIPSPNGRSLAILRLDPNNCSTPATFDIVMRDLRSGSERALVSDRPALGQRLLGWSADSRRLLYESAARPEAARGASFIDVRTGQDVPMKGLRPDTGTYRTVLGYLGKRDRVAVLQFQQGDDHADVVTIDPATGKGRRLFALPGRFVNNFDADPTGRNVVLVAGTGRDGGNDIAGFRWTAGEEVVEFADGVVDLAWVPSASK